MLIMAPARIRTRQVKLTVPMEQVQMLQRHMLSINNNVAVLKLKLIQMPNKTSYPFRYM